MKRDIFFYWKIGKMICSFEDSCFNIHEKISSYFSYYYGYSHFYTRENVYLMKRLYLNFPIFYDSLNLLSWNQYRLLFQIQNREEMYFYFRLSLLFHSNDQETFDLIDNQYFLRI